jgi:hypothetical protein
MPLWPSNVGGTPMAKGESAKTLLIKTLAAIAAGAALTTSAFAQSARTPLIAIENEPAPKLVVDPPLTLDGPAGRAG